MTTKNKKSANAGKPVWFITGCSTGFGRELATQALARGFRTVVTARKPEQVKALAATGDALVLKLDVTDQGQIDAAIKAATEKFGRIDVLVNNAGIGYFAAIEEGEENEVRRMFEINVFGLGRMIQAVLPGMRQRRQGCIVNISSLAGLRSAPALGFYNATKFAVEGLSGALLQEVEPLGIKVIVVEPSGFRTDWAGRSADESKKQIADYAKTAGAWRTAIRADSGKQPGDPVRAVIALIEAVESPKPPRHLLLGNDSYEGAMAKLDELRKDFSAVEKIARGADFPKDKSKKQTDSTKKNQPKKMKHTILSLVITVLALGSLSSANAATETYNIDPVHTWVGFSVAHFFTKVPGYFSQVKGTIVVDRDHLEKSTVEAVIDVASITTNTKMRDDDLRSTNFFAAARFPSMTFKSESWKSTGDNTYAVTGMLTMKNVSKAVVLKVTSLGFGPGMKGAAISGWEASLTLDRRDFDIAADQGAIGNSVDVLINVEADLQPSVLAKP
jgi:NAD(P)-dependent dehydrogenase (short-subunit alcohol dehydrogenase family)/polyisoprenoid-binding protein YceI